MDSTFRLGTDTSGRREPDNSGGDCRRHRIPVGLQFSSSGHMCGQKKIEGIVGY